MITIQRHFNQIEKKGAYGNIVIKTRIGGEETEIIGFENHGGQTFDVDTPFGEVIVGNGNRFNAKEEGFFRKNVIATYLHGPLLSKNPKLCDYIISYGLERKYGKKVELENLDDTFEEKCREQLLAKFIKES